jgi:threonine dehydratase
MRHHEAGNRAPTLVRQQTVAETWAEIRQFSPPVTIGEHSYLPDGRPLLAASATGLPSGTFKERGGIGKTISLHELGHTAATLYSAGNHLIGSAIGARHVGMHIHGFLPSDAPTIKEEKAVDLGGGYLTVTRVDGGLNEAREAAFTYAQEQNVPILEPYDDVVVARSQGTVAHELLMAHPDIDYLLVPAGGFGLGWGCMQAIRQAGLRTKVVGVKLSSEYSLCEGSNVAKLGEVARRGIGQNLDLWGGIRKVDLADVGAMVAYEDSIRTEHAEAMGGAAWYEHPEATALLGAAAAHKFFARYPGKIATIITGSNADHEKLDTLHDRFLQKSNRKKSKQPRKLHVASAHQLRRTA